MEEIKDIFKVTLKNNETKDVTVEYVVISKVVGFNQKIEEEFKFRGIIDDGRGYVIVSIETVGDAILL